MTAAFVLHAHSGYGPLHYDLMLEQGGVLETWQFSESPVAPPQDKHLIAKRLPAHRLAYLDYDGPVSKSRGEVRALDKGAYDLLDAQESCRLVRFHGRCLQGLFELKQSEPCSDEWAFRRVPAGPRPGPA